MKTIRRFLLVTAAVAIGSTVASASSIFVDTFTFGPGAGYNYNLAGPVSGTISFGASLQKFDDNLLGVGGTLQNIAFVLSATNAATASATNGVLNCGGGGCTPGGPLNVLTIGGTVPVAVVGPSGMNTNATPQATTSFATPGFALQNIFSSCAGFICTVTPGNILTVSGLTNTTGSSTNVANSPASFAPYHTTGGGNFISGLTITVGPAGVVGVGDSKVDYQASSTINGSLQVIYTYDTAAPEPATAGLMGSALIGLALVMRRKIAKR